MSKELGNRGRQDEIYDLDDFHMYEKGEEPFLEEDDVATQSVANNTPVDSSPSLNGVNSSSKDNGKSLKSVVWLDMIKTTIEGKVFAVCNHCSLKLNSASINGTKHLHNHLARCKKRKSKDIKQMFLQVSRKKAKAVEYKSYSFSQDVSRNDLAEMIIMHEILGVACILDPRYKMKLIEFYLPLIHGHDASLEIHKIRSSCYDLLEEYQSKVREDENVVDLPSSNNSCLVVNMNDPLSSFDKYLSSTSSHVNVKSELDHYLEEINLPRSPKFDVLAWWKTNGLKFPTLQKIARDILAIPISSVASESAFSTSGRLVSPHRSRLTPNILEALMCSQNWLQNENEGLSLKSEEERNLATCLDDVDV